MPDREQRRKEKDRLAQEVGIVFDMKNIDVLDQGIATLGQSTTANTEVGGPLSPLQEDNNKRKKIRNVLHRRPSANTSQSPQSPPPPSRSASTSATVSRSNSRTASTVTFNSTSNQMSPPSTLPPSNSPLSPLIVPLSLVGEISSGQDGIRRSLSTDTSGFHHEVPLTSSMRPPLLKSNSTPGSRKLEVAREHRLSVCIAKSCQLTRAKSNCQYPPWVGSRVSNCLSKHTDERLGIGREEGTREEEQGEGFVDTCRVSYRGVQGQGEVEFGAGKA